MSFAPEQAVAELGQCVARMVPQLLDQLAALRSDHPTTTLLPPSDVFAQLAPLASSDDVKRAFALIPPSTAGDADAAAQTDEGLARLRNLCVEVGSNQLRDVVYQAATPPTDPAQPATAGVGGSAQPLPQQLADDSLRSIVDRLDVVLALALQGLVDTALPLTLVEELLELNTIPTCSQLFAYIESRVKQLTVDLHPMRGKGLVLLRLCNELLRRLSKPSHKHTVFAGRILSLLAAVFPLGERSGVNLRGDFNVENRTILEDQPAHDDRDGHAEGSKKVDGGGDGADEKGDDDDDKAAAIRPDAQMYELFWSMQRFFSNPPLLMGLQDTSRQSSRTATPAPPAGSNDGGNPTPSEEDPAPDGAKGPMSELRISTKRILALFAAVAKRERELAGAAAAENANAANQSGGAKANGSNGKAANGTQKPAQLAIGYRAGQDTGDSATLASDEGTDSGDGPRKRERYEPDIKDGVRVSKTAKTEDDADGDAEMASASDDAEDRARAADLFFPKFLTGRRLLEYEIRDASFRRHILVQYLILFQYLLSFTPVAREKWKDWKNRNLQGMFVLEEADEQWVRKVWKEVVLLLRDIPPNGRAFLDATLEVLKREANWIRWKADSCPSIEKPPLSPDQIAAFASARASLLRPPRPYSHPLGTAALSELWAEGFPPPVPGTRRVENDEGVYVDVATDGLEELEFLPPVPTLSHYHGMIKREEMKLNMRRRQLGIVIDTDAAAAGPAKMSAEDADKESKDAKCQSIRETMQSLAWRALRVASDQHLHLFKQMKEPENISALMKAIDDERNPPPPPKAKSVEAGEADDEAKKEGGEDVKESGEEAESKAEAGTEAETAPAHEDVEAKERAAADDEAATEAAAAAVAVPVSVPEVPQSPAPAGAATEDEIESKQPPTRGSDEAAVDASKDVDAAAVDAELGVVEEGAVKEVGSSEVSAAVEDVEMASADKA
ncbi:uncharacterized protein PFL1_01432 [Pseudozyma flocculosa PF-1]|uniref:Related to nuclear matrix protein p84 n=1 Tax=Pseudozyma flocculosa TaxID=84751 RepID=A0A5C3EWU8_9BASI|nr:uncharacterized protein PFL1_01432 [Pseudozyma flocculosa PF-1]EPQ31247.1 hypothetical protein PFL1_01432 [Pseudozyma flocculosa PF-1]SPO36255.1 related to nuclear matrix protein p84 [Pseudozyma flocculosa]